MVTIALLTKRSMLSEPPRYLKRVRKGYRNFLDTKIVWNLMDLLFYLCFEKELICLQNQTLMTDAYVYLETFTTFPLTVNTEMTLILLGWDMAALFMALLQQGSQETKWQCQLWLLTGNRNA